METLIIGVFYLLIGQLVRVFPNIIAGYSSLSFRQRENAEKNGLKFYSSLLFSVMGGIILIGYPVSIWIANPRMSLGIVVIVSVVGMIVAVVGGNLLTNNRFK